MNIPIKYRENPKKLSTNDFWDPIKNFKDSNGMQYIDPGLAFDVELYRSFIMNPLSHTQLAVAPRRDIENAIATVEKLEQVLDEIVKNKKSST